MTYRRARRRTSSLKARRDAVRARRAHKTFNLHWVNDTLDQVIVELSEYSEREPEIAAAMESMLAAKRLVQAYSQRMLDTPYRSSVRRYNDYFDNFEFDDASEIFDKQRKRND